MDDALLDSTTWDHDGTRSIMRAEAIAVAREVGVRDDIGDERIWAAWERHASGPTNRADLDRVVAELAADPVDR
jgi:hypothetical protein